MEVETDTAGTAQEARRAAEPRLLVSFRDATLGYGRRPVLRGVSLDLCEGDFLGVVGPNGSGKSTLVKSMLGLLRPLEGELTVSAGTCALSPRNSSEGPGTRRQGRTRFGYVPQRDTLDPIFPLQVREIVAMGRYGRVGLIRRLGRTDREAVERALERVGIADLARRGYGELSGGQRQRTLIARALAAEPEMLVLDEPTNGMDLSSEHALLELIRDLHERSGLTVLLVTHLLSNVANYADRIAIIAGERLEVGPRDEMLTEARLSSLYGIPVLVDRVGDRVAVVPASTGGPQ
jgi:ABC-type Mn2+/Zn2+ transport system ATPase subunit